METSSDFPNISALHTLNPVTPKRSTKAHDPKTPNRSEDLAAVQTPRRSVRKSIKPVQDYENIVAQKGLSAKRIVISSLEDEAEPTDSKWEPSVIGRTSSKRGKKSRNAKNKKLKRQKKIESDTVEIERVEAVPGEVPQHDHAVVIDTVPDGVIQDENKENIHLGQKTIKNELSKDAKPPKNAEPLLENENSKKENDHKQVNNDESKASLITEPVVETLDDTLDSSFSTEGGDVEMATMPITADDCLENLDNFCQLKPIDVNKRLTSNTSNTTDYSDCIILSLNENSNAEQIMNISSEKLETGDTKSMHNSSEPTDMPPLFVCSEDEEDPINLDKTCNGSDIVELITSPHQKVEENKPIVDTEQFNNTFDADEKSEKPIILQENKSPVTTEQLNNTFDADEASEKIDESITPHTPMFRPSISRIPTPFKSNKATASDIDNIIEEDVEVIEVPQLLVERTDVILKSSRKRSLSECIDRPKKMVTFHSPANTTVSIYEADLMKGVGKKETTLNNVTQRRKRSLSVTETHRDMLAYIREKRIVDVSSDKKRKLPQPSSATKMPNFAAIHQHHFKKMESISDHIARKAERAKVLSNSASKFKPTSVQKGLPSKNFVLREFNKDHFTVGNKSALPVAKARKRIELCGDETKLLKMESNLLDVGVKSRSKSKPDLSTLDDLPSIRKTPSKFSASTSSIFEAQKLKPKFNLTLSGLEAPLNSTLFKNEATTTSKSSANVSKVIVPHTKPKLPDPRQAFNRSTLIEKSAAPKEADGDRRKRIMDMYKSRVATKTRETNKEILKGVRTNRRFELQMMCRNRPK